MYYDGRVSRWLAETVPIAFDTQARHLTGYQDEIPFEVVYTQNVFRRQVEYQAYS